LLGFNTYHIGFDFQWRWFNGVVVLFVFLVVAPSTALAQGRHLVTVLRLFAPTCPGPILTRTSQWSRNGPRKRRLLGFNRYHIGFDS